MFRGISAKFGRMYTANGSVLSKNQISQWTKIKNPVEDTSYRHIFFNSNGSWKPRVGNVSEVLIEFTMRKMRAIINKKRFLK